LKVEFSRRPTATCAFAQGGKFWAWEGVDLKNYKRFDLIKKILK
jgi:hypothetical protein